MKKINKAFILVELVIVIIILTILGMVAFVSLQGFTQNSRDSVRISDVSEMEVSLELFRSNEGLYPLPDNGNEVTYSGNILWKQGFFGEKVVSQLGKSMNKHE